MATRIFIMFGIALIVLGVGVYFISRVFLSNTAEVFIDTLPSPGATTTITELPSSVDVLPPAQLLSTTGTVYTATPIISNPQTVKLDEGFYVLTEDPSTYDIFYNEPTGILFISLYKEPLGFSRALAERMLRDTLPLTEEELCTLQVKVTTNSYVDPVYDGLNLGLSFCPGSVELE